jgi:regulatory protein
LTGLRNNKQASPEPFAAALRMLARRPYSIAELRQALEKKCPQNEQVDVAIARLRELGYLDDRKFAEQYAYSLARNRAFGPYRLRRELKGKLLSAEDVELAVERVYQETPSQTLLEQALNKKLRTVRFPLSRTKFHSLCQSLMRLGFNSGDIIKAVRARAELNPVAEEIEAVDLEGE